jgi:glyoxylase-like metal-dependent hydrolase (beta-lactamase superfamily II)
MLHVKVFLFNPVQENTYLIYNEEKDCIIIDPGCYYENEQEKLAGFITENQLKPVLLLNTHCHLDHIFGNKFIAEKYSLTLHIHPLEKKLLEMAPASGLMWNLPFDNYQGNLEYLVPGKPINLGNDAIRVLFTPGHSPGSVSFYSPENGFVISGDVLFRESIGRTDLPGGDFSVLSRSIIDQLYSLPGETVVYSGHGSSTDINWEKAHNPYVKDSWK